jgi:hypothetical protein
MPSLSRRSCNKINASNLEELAIRLGDQQESGNSTGMITQLESQGNLRQVSLTARHQENLYLNRDPAVLASQGEFQQAGSIKMITI